MEELGILKSEARGIVVGSNLLLWPLAIILLVINRFYPNQILTIIVLLLLAKFIISLLKITNISMKVFACYYPDKRYPPQRRNILFINCLVILPILGFSIYNTAFGKHVWITALLMAVSFILFTLVGFMIA